MGAACPRTLAAGLAMLTLALVLALFLVVLVPTIVAQVEDIVDAAISECERFYPAFQFVVWGGKAPGEALTAAMIDPVGEA